VVEERDGELRFSWNSGGKGPEGNWLDSGKDVAEHIRFKYEGQIVVRD